MLGKNSISVIEPTHVSSDIRDVINSSMAMANIEGQIEAQKMRDFVMEFKARYPKLSIKCTETISFTIEGEQTNSLIGYIFGKNPDTRFRMTKAYRPEYQAE